MTCAEIDELIERHFRAEEAGDPDAAVADLAHDVLHEVAGAHRFRSRESARAFYEDLFGKMRLQKITSERRMYGASFAVDEAFVDAVTSSGTPTPFRLLHIFEFADGQISRESAWQSPASDATVSQEARTP